MLLLLCVVSWGHAADAAPPNIVIILGDDGPGWGDWDAFAPTGIRTPNLDRLVAEGARFTSFYATPICTTTRAELMTGRKAPRDGWSGALQPTSTGGIDAVTVTLPEMLKPAGYTSMLVGKWHLGILPKYNPTRHGFDQFFGLPNGAGNYDAVTLPLMSNEELLYETTTPKKLTSRLTQEAVKFIATAKPPFLLYFAHTAAHIPFPSGVTYSNLIEGIDQSTRKVMEAIKARGIDQDTIVIFLADNGPDVTHGGGDCGPLSGGKNGSRECGIRVPLAARWPGHIPAGRTMSAPAQVADLFPTFAKLAGLPAPLPARIDGKDISPVLLGTGTRAGSEFAFFRVLRMEACRIGAWKLHFRKDGMVGPLYNLAADLGEAHPVTNQVALKASTRDRCRQLDAAIPHASETKQ
jgi:arylsulfatase A-like enzyme